MCTYAQESLDCRRVETTFLSMRLVLRLQVVALVFKNSPCLHEQTLLLAQHSLAGPLLCLLEWLHESASLLGSEGQEGSGARYFGVLCGQEGPCLPESIENMRSQVPRRAGNL